MPSDVCRQEASLKLTALHSLGRVKKSLNGCAADDFSGDSVLPVQSINKVALNDTSLTIEGVGHFFQVFERTAADFQQCGPCEPIVNIRMDIQSDLIKIFDIVLVDDVGVLDIIITEVLDRFLAPILCRLNRQT